MGIRGIVGAEMHVMGHHGQSAQPDLGFPGPGGSPVAVWCARIGWPANGALISSREVRGGVHVHVVDGGDPIGI